MRFVANGRAVTATLIRSLTPAALTRCRPRRRPVGAGLTPTEAAAAQEAHDERQGHYFGRKYHPRKRRTVLNGNEDQTSPAAHLITNQRPSLASRGQ